jgi:hypothetical protein
MSGWLTVKKRKINDENKQPNIEHKIVPEFKYPKKFDPTSPPPTPKYKIPKAWRMQPLTPTTRPPLKSLTEEEIMKYDEQLNEFGSRVFALPYTPPSDSPPPPPKRNKSSGIDETLLPNYSNDSRSIDTSPRNQIRWMPMNHNLGSHSSNDETPTERLSGSHSQEETPMELTHSQDDSNSQKETLTEHLSGSNGGKRSRKTSRKTSRKKSKSKKYRKSKRRHR